MSELGISDVVNGYIEGIISGEDRIEGSEGRFENSIIRGEALRVASAPSHLWRPRTLIMAARGHGISENFSLPYAAALELRHVETLILDDLPCMDDADTRRNQASSHKEVGEDLAILTAYYLRGLSGRMIASGRASADQSVRILNEYDIACSNLALGQEMDLREAEQFDRVDQIYELARLKTGALFSAAMVTGGILGGVDEGILDSYREAGYHMGIMYQVGDDIYDGFFVSEDLGKPVGNDPGKRLVDFVPDKGAAMEIRQRFEDKTLEILTRAGNNAPLSNLVQDMGQAFKGNIYGQG